MKVFLDTAEIEEIKFAASLGVIDGVTTNPSLIKQAVDKHGEEGYSDYEKATRGGLTCHVMHLLMEVQGFRK